VTATRMYALLTLDYTIFVQDKIRTRQPGQAAA